MGELKESSVLFSLRDLMDIENDRVQREDEARQRQIEEDRRRRLEAEARARVEEERRLLAQEERRRHEEARRREESARLEAIAQAEIARAKAEAEHRARLELAAAQQSHEREIVALREDRTKRRYARLAAAAGLATVIAFGGGLGWYFGVAKPRAERELAERRAEAAATDERLAALTRDIDRRKSELEGLRGKLREQKEAELRALEEKRKLERDKRAAPPAGRPGVRAPRKDPAPTTPAAAPCPEGDPMCGRLE